MEMDFRVRYHARPLDGSDSAMFVEDGNGTLYLFSGGKLQARLNSLTGSGRIETYLARARYAWYSVDSDDRHPFEALGALALRFNGAGTTSA